MAGFNAEFDPKDKMTLRFGIIGRLSLMLVVSQQIGLKFRLNTRYAHLS